MTDPASRAHILLTNDDGFDAAGIKALYTALAPRFDVTIAAPDHDQSGISHAFSLDPISVCRHAAENGSLPGFRVRGTPSDCIKLAISRLLGRRPDVVVSGMNVGENSGISGYYSGTVAAAREGAFWRIPSFAFSMSGDNTALLAGYSRWAADILAHLLKQHARRPFETENRIFFNVNFPSCAPEACKGLLATRQSLAWFDDRYRQVPDANGAERFQIYGEKSDLEPGDLYDSRALLNGWATITPLDFDATAESARLRLSESPLPVPAPASATTPRSAC